MTPAEIAALVLGFDENERGAAVVAVAMTVNNNLDPALVTTLPNGSRSRGILQWNSARNPEIDDAQALDVGCSFWWYYKKSGGFRQSVAGFPKPHYNDLNKGVTAVRAVKMAHGDGLTYSTPPVVGPSGNPLPGTWKPGTAGDASAFTESPTIQTEIGEAGKNGQEMVDAIPVIGDAAALIAALGRIVVAALNPDTWRRAALVVGGIVAAIIAMSLIIGDTRIGREIATTAKGATPIP